jgi:hypothetical protein
MAKNEASRLVMHFVFATVVPAQWVEFSGHERARSVA